MSSVCTVGQGQSVVLAVVFAVSLIANIRGVRVPGGRRSQRLLEVEGIRIGFLQDLRARLGKVGRGALHRGRRGHADGGLRFVPVLLHAQLTRSVIISAIHG